MGAELDAVNTFKRRAFPFHLDCQVASVENLRKLQRFEALVAQINTDK